MPVTLNVTPSTTSQLRSSITFANFSYQIGGQVPVTQSQSVDLSSTGGTWVVMLPGEVLPSGSVIAIGERLLQVLAPEGSTEVTVADCAWQTAVYVAA